jgi:glycosyltransferase involved in cell wall biosynthesis
MSKKVKITIAIPAYNAEKTILESIQSALKQEYPLKEVLVIDDGSTDSTATVVSKIPGVRLVKHEKNLGIGITLVDLINEAEGKYIVFLCSDDIFTSDRVCHDIVRIFDDHGEFGVISRYYYQYMNGHEGAIMVCRDKNIITASCNPSGMAFRKMDGLQATNKMFIECPSIVAQYLPHWRWTMLEYDTIAARIHPGGNTGTKEEYYMAPDRGGQIENWVSMVGPSFRFHQGFIQIKNRAPKRLWKEIKDALRLTPAVKREPLFWFYIIVAVVVPGSILRPLANFYRHRIVRHNVSIISREDTSWIAN